MKRGTDQWGNWQGDRGRCINIRAVFNSSGIFSTTRASAALITVDLAWRLNSAPCVGCPILSVNPRGGEPSACKVRNINEAMVLIRLRGLLCPAPCGFHRCIVWSATFRYGRTTGKLMPGKVLNSVDYSIALQQETGDSWILARRDASSSTQRCRNVRSVDNFPSLDRKGWLWIRRQSKTQLVWWRLSSTAFWLEILRSKETTAFRRPLFSAQTCHTSILPISSIPKRSDGDLCLDQASPVSNEPKIHQAWQTSGSPGEERLEWARTSTLFQRRTWNWSVWAIPLFHGTWWMSTSTEIRKSMWGKLTDSLRMIYEEPKRSTCCIRSDGPIVSFATRIRHRRPIRFMLKRLFWGQIANANYSRVIWKIKTTTFNILAYLRTPTWTFMTTAHSGFMRGRRRKPVRKHR